MLNGNADDFEDTGLETGGLGGCSRGNTVPQSAPLSSPWGSFLRRDGREEEHATPPSRHAVMRTQRKIPYRGGQGRGIPGESRNRSARGALRFLASLRRAPVTPGGGLSFGATAACGAVGLCVGGWPAAACGRREEEHAAPPSRHAVMRTQRKIPYREDRGEEFLESRETEAREARFGFSHQYVARLSSPWGSFFRCDGRMWVGGIMRGRWPTSAPCGRRKRDTATSRPAPQPPRDSAP